MGAARLNIPAIMVTGGYMPLGHCGGKEVTNMGGSGLGWDRYGWKDGC